MKKWLFIILVFITGTLYAYWNIGLTVAAGWGFNGNLYLNQTEVERVHGFVATSGFVLEKPLGDSPLCLSTGIYGKYVYNQARIGITEVYLQTLRLAVPLTISYRFKVAGIHAGFSAQCNRDFAEFVPDQADNWRYNAEVGADYALFPRISVSFQYIRALSGLGDPYLLADPEHSLLLGTRFYLVKTCRP